MGYGDDTMDGACRATLGAEAEPANRIDRELYSLHIFFNLKKEITNMAKPIEFGALFMLVLLWIGAISAATAGDSAIKPAKLFDLGIYVEDLDHSAAFYQTVFGLKVTKRWTYMTNFDKNGAEQKAELAGMYIGGGHGMSLEFLQRANVAKRQVAQEPINHFALAVDDVDAALDRALKAGAKLAFPGQRLFKTRAADMLVIHSQIIGLDGERIQILQELK